MAIVRVPEQERSITAIAEIVQFLEKFGIEYQLWPLPTHRFNENSAAQEILEAYKDEIEKQKAKGGYTTADVVNLSPDTPGLEELLAKFKTEHTHSEDEVRFCIKGRGIFHVNPGDAPVFSIEMVAGDLISVPKGTRHWFNLCQDKTIQVIRLFQDKTGWTPQYLEEEVELKYEPLCFSQTANNNNNKPIHKSVVAP